MDSRRTAFDDMVNLPAAEREVRLVAIESTDAWLAGQLRALFAADARAASFLERDPVALPGAQGMPVGTSSRAPFPIEGLPLARVPM